MPTVVDAPDDEVVAGVILIRFNVAVPSDSISSTPSDTSDFSSSARVGRMLRRKSALA